MSSAAGRGPRGALLPGGGAGHAPSPAPPRLMRRLPAARTGTWAPRPRRGLGFQMHARFPLIARIRDHYTWIPQTSMAVADHWS